MSDHLTVTKSILINAPALKVWETITNPSQIILWMSDPPMEVTTDWQVGSPIIFRGGIKGREEYKGIILKFEPLKIFQYSSWTRITRLPDIPENYALIQFALEPVETGTRLTITHSNLIAKAAMEHANFYWNTTLFLIKKLSEE